MLVVLQFWFVEHEQSEVFNSDQMYLLHACMYGHERDVGLFEEVGDVIHVDASLHAYCEDSECYIQFGIF